MPNVTVDAYGHQSPNTAGTLGTALAAGAVSTTAIGTIVPTTAAGASPTVTGVNAVDMAGTFTLNPVTGGGAQAAGAVAQVFFSQPFAATPKAVNVDMCDNAAGANGVAVTASAQSVTTTGFTVNVGSALTTAHNYNCYFSVSP
jgi:H-type lectin domain